MINVVDGCFYFVYAADKTIEYFFWITVIYLKGKGLKTKQNESTEYENNLKSWWIHDEVLRVTVK